MLKNSRVSLFVIFPLEKSWMLLVLIEGIQSHRTTWGRHKPHSTRACVTLRAGRSQKDRQDEIQIGNLGFRVWMSDGERKETKYWEIRIHPRQEKEREELFKQRRLRRSREQAFSFSFLDSNCVSGETDFKLKNKSLYFIYQWMNGL